MTVQYEIPDDPEHAAALTHVDDVMEVEKLPLEGPAEAPVPETLRTTPMTEAERAEQARILKEEGIYKLMVKMGIPAPARQPLYVRIFNNWKPEKGPLENYIRKTINPKPGVTMIGPDGEWMERPSVKRGKGLQRLSIDEAITDIEKGEGGPRAEGPQYRGLAAAEEEARVKNLIRKAATGTEAARNGEIVIDYVLGDSSAEEVGQKYGLSGQAVLDISKKIYEGIKKDPGLQKILDERNSRSMGFLYPNSTERQRTVQKETLIRAIQRWFSPDRGVGEIVNYANMFRQGGPVAEVFGATHDGDKIDSWLEKQGNPVELRRRLYNAMKGIGGETIAGLANFGFPPKIIEVVTRARKRLDEMSRMLMQFAHMDLETWNEFNRNLGTYLPRKFAMYEMEPGKYQPTPAATDAFVNWLKRYKPAVFNNYTDDDWTKFLQAVVDGADTVPGPAQGSFTPAMLKKELFIKKKNLPKEFLDFAGEIKDPVWLYKYAIVHTAVAAYNAQFLQILNDEFPNLSTDNPDIARREGWIHYLVPKNPARPHWGALQGKYLHPNLWRLIHEDIPDTAELSNWIMRNLVGPFKATRTVMSVPGQVKNALGNLQFTIMAGVSPLNPLNWPYWIEAFDIAVHRAGSRQTDWEQLLRDTIVGNQFWGNEAGPLFRDLLKLSPKTRLEVIKGWLRTKGPPGLVELGGKLYNLGDEIPRIAAHLKNRAKGMSVEESVQWLNMTMQNYRNLPEFANLLKKSMALGPFSSFKVNTLYIGGRYLMTAIESMWAGMGLGRPVTPPTLGGRRWVPGVGPIPPPPMPTPRGGRRGKDFGLPGQPIIGRGIDPKLFWKGFRMLGILAFTFFAANLASDISKMVAGVKKEDIDEFEKNCLPEYRRGGQYIYFRYKSGPRKGYLGAIDVTWWPFAQMQRDMKAVMSIWRNDLSFETVTDTLNVFANPVIDAYKILIAGEDPRDFDRKFGDRETNLGTAAMRMGKLLSYAFVPSSSPVPDIGRLIREGKIGPGDLTGDNFRGVLNAVALDQAQAEARREGRTRQPGEVEIHGKTKDLKDEVMAFFMGIRKWQIDPVLEANKYRLQLTRERYDAQQAYNNWATKNPAAARKDGMNVPPSERSPEWRRLEALKRDIDRKIRLCVEARDKLIKSSLVPAGPLKQEEE